MVYCGKFYLIQEGELKMKLSKKRLGKALKIWLIIEAIVVLFSILVSGFMKIVWNIPMTEGICAGLPGIKTVFYYVLCGVVMFLSGYFFITDKSGEK